MQVALENAQAERVQKEPATSFTVAPLTPTIGAEIGQIDLAAPLDEASLHALRATLLTWKVIFFRKQDITTEQHIAFARQFGPLEIHPFSACKPGYPEVLAITHGPKNRGAENVWHTDVTWRIEPSFGSILRAIEVPPVGGDTLFADMYAAYDELPDNVKAELEGKRARHTMGFYDGVLRKRGASQAEMDALYAKYPPTDHPLVRTHPETGRKALYLNPGFIQEVIGLIPEEIGRAHV